MERLSLTRPRPTDRLFAQWVRPLEHVGRRDVELVGRKCAVMGELMAAGLEVPQGFAVTAAAYRHFVEANGLAALLERASPMSPPATPHSDLPATLPADLPADLAGWTKQAERIREAFLAVAFPAELEQAIREACDALAESSGGHPLAVRSSPATGNGRVGPFLNLNGPAEVLRHVRLAWAGLHDAQALAERAQRGESNSQAATAVAVQRMVASESSGIVVPQEGSRVVVESTWGLGDGFAKGAFHPDRFVVDRSNLAVVERDVMRKRVQKVPRRGGSLTDVEAVPGVRCDAPSLTEEEVVRLVEALQIADGRLGGPQQLEFVIEWVRDQRRIRIVESTPASTGPNAHVRPQRKGHAGAQQAQEGEAAARASQPVPVAAPGPASHPRPARRGEARPSPPHHAAAAAPARGTRPFGAGAQTEAPAAVTSTRLLVNLDAAADAPGRAALGADGPGLLRAERLVGAAVDDGDFVARIARGLGAVAKAFPGRRVHYRFLDLDPDLSEGWLGYRGLLRAVRRPDGFRLECRAVRQALDTGEVRSLALLLPFVRTVREVRAARRILEEEGLARSRDVQWWMMAETPASVLMVDRFLEEGFDGLAIGTGDLAMLLLGASRDDPAVQGVYDERNPAVLRALAMLAEACHARGVATALCGPGACVPEVLEAAVALGIGTVMAEPDCLAEVRATLASAEQRLLLGLARERAVA